ncbi:MAG TPA: ribose 5-phosphate isomerase B [Syntrophales bacterium]|nr:ribose 5-phosphate isomerase B [Syntrophales bacterium]
MRIIIGSDHAGFALKESVRQSLTSGGFDVVDAGTHCGDSVDYPDYGMIAAERVSSGEFDRGILICGSGVGMAIVANKFPSIRAALCLDEETARLSRQHNDSNILVLAGRKTEAAAAKGIVRTWLETPFEGGRHQKRLDKIRELEKKLCK